MKVTPALKKELAQWLDTYWTTYLKGDIDTWATFIRDDYRNIGGTKEEIWNSKQEILDYTNSILDQMLGAAEIRNREIEVIPYGEYMMVNEFTDLFVKAEGEWTLYGPFRMSSLLEKTDTGWIALHQHGSYPDMKAMEGEAFSMDAVKAENAKLMEMVKIRTAELEIEAALERVRAVAMGMKKPEDMLDVCRIISDQLQQFGVEKIRNVQTAIIDENIGQYLCYQYFKPYDKTVVEKTEYLKSPVEHGMVSQMLASRDGYFIGRLGGKELEEFRIHRKEEGHFPDPHLDDTKELACCFLSIGEGGLGLTLYQPMEADVLTLFKRFHQVFSLAYQRFRDIEKAEAQAREAQIEVAVEKVRAQSMAMHHPDDLDKVNKEILTQLNWLQIRGLSGVTFYLVDQDGWVKAYDFSSPGNIGNQNSYTLQFDFKKYEMMGYPFKIFEQTDLNYFVADFPLEKLEKAVFEIEEINPEVATVIKEALAKGILTHQWGACARITDGVLGIDMISPPSEDTKTIVLKIAGAFNQAYQRFLDLQKAEAHARESEIDLALERVRAQTMAMHSSEDVGKCVVKMFSELTALGVDEGTRFGIGILNHDNENNQLWTARKNGDEVNMHIGNIDMASHPLLKSARKAWKEKIPLHKYVLEGEDLVNYYQMLNNAPDYKIQILIEKLPEREIQHCFIFEHGFFYAFSPREFQPDLIHITQRFSSLFEQTYRRYLDLVRAEAQAREAEIELALERVRAKTMAMHHTEELKEVIQVVFDQFVGLNIHVDHAGFILDYKEREDMHIWLADHQQGVPTEITIPYFDSPHWNSYREAKTKEESFFANLLPFEVKNKFYRDLFERIPELTEEAQQAIFSKPALAISTVLLDNVGLYIEHYSETPFTAEENAILMRFGKVFQQTYTRFLDLQKAEVQTREAQIQLSLERIRAKALAMQHSDELSDFLTVLFEQFDVLNLNPVFCHLSLLDIDNNRCTYRMTGKNGARLFTSGEIDLNISTVWDTKIEELKSGKPREVDVMYFPNESILEISSHVKEMLGNPPENELPQPEEFPDGQYVIEGYCKYGYLGYSASRPPSDEEKEITKRIANEFGNVYQRFLDLQKAEELARESEIELALERIRARTIGMQKSEELTDTAALVFHQIEELGIHQWGNAFQLWDDDMKLVTSWTCTHGVESLKSRIPATEDPVMINIVKAAQRGENLYVEEMGGEALENHYKFLTSLPVLKEVFEKLAKDGFKPPKFQVFHAAYFKYGYILFITQEPYPDAHDIFKRFAKVFEQTYTRFLDLQKAEAQAKEAQIEASLERVRSKTMAMHNSLEVGESVATLFEELSTLGLLDVNDRCGIGIMQPNEIMEAWTAAKTPEGKAELTIGHINMKLHPMMVSAYGGWLEKKEINQYILEGEDILSYYDAIRNQSDYKIKRDYFSDQLRIVHTDFYFNEGCLYVFSQNEFPANSIAVFLRFVGVFGQTYRRYLDLQKAEAQAREAEIQLALERVRARSLAMHHSEELADISLELVKQVQTLGMESWFCAFNIYDDDPRGSVEWGSNGQGTFPQYRTPREGVFLRYFEAGQRGETLLVNEIGEEECHAHYEYLCTLPGVGEQLLQMKAAGIPFPTSQIDHVAFFKYGYVLFITYEPASESHDIFKRFANVFEQSYTRFLDLQKAEAQARESQIEVSLERVRSRTMAMQHSSELTSAATLLFQQIQSLGVPPWSCGFNIWEQGDSVFTSYMGGGSEKFLLEGFKIPLTEEAVFIRFQESRDRGDELFVDVVEGEALESHYRYFFTLPGIKEVFEKAAQEGLPLPTFQINHLANFKHGNLMFITYEPCPEAYDIFIRFAKVFEQTYTRFLDLQKAEAQAREAQIESALERVRSRTMGMQRSDELSEVATLLFQQVKALGVPQWSCGFCIFEIDDKDFTWYPGGPNDEILPPCKIPLTEDPVFASFNESRKRGDELFVYEKEGEFQAGHYQYMLSLPIVGNWLQSQLDAGISFPDFQIDHVANFAYGNLTFITFEHFPEMHEVFKRFARVFQQTYTRFLDLQKAEAQAREAQIEAALERVRSRTMAMQNSSELAETSIEMFKQMQALGMRPWACGFNIFEKGEKAVTQWMSAADGGLLTPFATPLTEEPFFIKISEARQRGEELFVMESGGQELEETYKYMFSLPGSQKALGDVMAAGFEMPKFQISHCAFFSQGYLMFITYEPYPEAYDVFKRFAKVFEQTYTRFLDLQKSEAQAREAQIQLAMERVRARTMAMQKSQELPEAANLLFQQIQSLGMPAWSAGYCTWKEDLPTEKEGKSAVTLWMSSEGVLQPPFTAPTTDDKLFIQMREGAEKGKDLHVVELGGEELEQHYRYMRKIPVVGEILDSIIEAGHPLPTFQIMHQAYFSKGFLLFITYESVPESYDIFKRFAKVFDQTYTRFLDLQKAEAQAREAQIANALEKVRSRSLAMQSPDELIEVARLLREEMGALGVEELETSSIYIQEDHSGSTQCWFTIKNPDNPEKAITDQMTLNLQDTWVGRKMDEFVRSKATQTSILMQGEQRIEWIRYCEEKTELFRTSNFYGETIPDRTYHLYKFSNGYIGAAAPGEISTESWELLKRATAVFSFAYTRFRDLQMAQSSARAAMRQASLDRIRADISSMRNADDLGRITPLVFNELTTLGIPFIRCGVFIVHENKNNVEIYLSTPEGKSLAVMTLPFSANEMTSKSVEAWKKGEVYVQHWNQTDFINWGKSMQEQGYVKDLKTYQGADAAPESLHLHFVPFAQGLLYVGSTETLSEEQIDLVKALAKSFAIAYARYEDFVKLEHAKSAVESAMNELKSTQSQLVQQEKLASLGQLTAGIAHEIKNPLNFVNNFSEVSIEMIEEVMEERSKSQDTRDETLVDEILEDIKSNLQKVHEHGTRANGIVTSMLQHSRGGSGKMEPTNLNSLIKEYVNLSFHGMRANKNLIDVDIALDLDPQITDVPIIKEDFTRVVINLCNNAFDAMREKILKTEDRRRKTEEGDSGNIKYDPKLKVITSLENGQVRIFFEDNGPGIPDEIKDKILQPFFTTKKGTEGTGLGLSITNDIIKVHGGELTVNSTSGTGSIFIITLKP